MCDLGQTLVVTQDQLNKIYQLRANGHSHQEIADIVDISRSSVAYHLKKRKSTSIPLDQITIIYARGFVPNRTTISFTPYSFENHRQGNQIYAVGQDMYEIRENDIIHKTTLPKGVSPSTYS